MLPIYIPVIYKKKNISEQKSEYKEHCSNES